MVPDEYYHLLRVNRYTSKETLRRAFRSSILSTHPDHNPNDTLATERTRNLIEAYKVLCSEENAEVIRQKPVRRATPAAPVKRASSSFRQCLWRMTTALLTIMSIVCLSTLLAHVITADRGQVFRPYTCKLDYPAPAPMVAVTLDPDPSDIAAWYSEREYKLSLAEGYATNRMMQVYENAAQRAAARGDKQLARFYLVSMKNISACRTLPSFRIPKSALCIRHIRQILPN